jgi:hypothetical protein
LYPNKAKGLDRTIRLIPNTIVSMTPALLWRSILSLLNMTKYFKRLHNSNTHLCQRKEEHCSSKARCCQL